MMKLLFLIFIGIGSTTALLAQSKGKDKISTTDSVKINTNIERFYSWYASMIKRNRLDKEFNPIFIMTKDGMTALDFTNYKAGLRKHDFSDDFIDKRITNFKPCLDNLKHIPYDRVAKFENLDQFEEINCAFANVHEWTKSMDSLDGAELVTLNKVDKHTIEATIKFYNKTPKGINNYWGSVSLTLKKFKESWMIIDLR